MPLTSPGMGPPLGSRESSSLHYALHEDPQIEELSVAVAVSSGRVSREARGRASSPNSSSSRLAAHLRRVGIVRRRVTAESDHTPLPTDTATTTNTTTTTTTATVVVGGDPGEDRPVVVGLSPSHPATPPPPRRPARPPGRAPLGAVHDHRANVGSPARASLVEGRGKRPVSVEGPGKRLASWRAQREGAGAGPAESSDGERAFL